MRKAVALVLILGLVFVDFLYFHDILKPGETTTVPQYVTGGLSIPVILFATYELYGYRARQRHG